MSRWEPRKRDSQLMASALLVAGLKSHAYRMSDCGSNLTFGCSGDDWRLLSANFCRERLCPMCGWRRSLKLYAQLSKCLDWIRANKTGYRYLFLTLTVVNVSGDALKAKLDQMIKGYYTLIYTPEIKRCLLGSYRTVEVTYNREHNTWHPHIHVLLCMSEDYFHGNNYLSHAKWLQLWRDIMDDQSIREVNIKTCKPRSDGRAPIAELTKYITKSKAILTPDDMDKSAELVRTLHYAVTNRRLISYAGWLKEANKALNLDDPEDGDLTVIDPDATIDKSLYDQIITYRWGGSGYVRSDD